MAKIKITRAEYISRVRHKSSWEAAFIRNIPLSGKGEDAYKKPYTNSHLAFICISTTARAISQVPIQVQIWKKDKWVPVPNHPYQLLLDKPNLLQSSYLFKESLVSHLLIDGNVWFLPIPPGVDVPKMMYPIQQRYMEKILDKTTGQLIGWNYTPQLNKEKIIIYADEVGHIRFFNPDDPILGQAPNLSGKFPLTSDYKAAAYNDRFFDNGGVTSGAFYTDKLLSKEQYERMKEQLDSRHSGYDKAHRFAVLEGGLKYQEIGIGHRDMDFLGLRKFSRDEILQIYGMKKAILSITDDLNYSTANEQKKEWWNSTLIPLMHLIESEFNRVLLHSTGLQDMRIAFDLIAVDALQDQFKDKVEMASRLYGMGCTFEQINERLNLGFETRPWQRFGYMSLATTPVGDDGLPLVDRFVPPKEEVVPIEEPKQIKLLTGKTEKEIRSELKDRKYGPRWKAFTRRLAPLENQMESKVSRVFFQMRKKVLEMTNEGKSLQFAEQKKVSPEEFLQRLRAEEFPEEKNLLQKYSSPIYTAAVSEGADSFIQEMGIAMDFNLKDPAALAFLGLKPIKIRNVTNTIKNNCLSQAQEGMGKGESIQQIAERIKTVFNASSSRAKMIARTEVIGASNFGRHAAMRESGFQMKEWYTAQDERVRDSHIEMGNSEAIQIDDSWKFAEGEVAYPGDWNGPASEVINCRCIEIVVPGSEEGVDQGVDIEESFPKIEESYNELEGENLDIMKTVNSEFWKNLSEEDQDALYGYRGFQYGKINGYKRGLIKETSSQIIQTADAIERILQNAPIVDKNLLFYRGFIGKFADDFLDLPVGTIWSDKGFTSVSSSLKTAKTYSRSGVLCEIRVPKGQRLFMFSENYQEGEHLFEAGTKFKILERGLIEGGVKVIMEVVK